MFIKISKAGNDIKVDINLQRYQTIGRRNVTLGTPYIIHVSNVYILALRTIFSTRLSYTWKHPIYIRANRHSTESAYCYYYFFLFCSFSFTLIFLCSRYIYIYIFLFWKKDEEKLGRGQTSFSRPRERRTIVSFLVDPEERSTVYYV